MIVTLSKHRNSGWPTSMHVVPLGDGGLLIHSPTWIDEAAMARIAALGTPRILFAPNHYHHLGLARFRQTFAQATVTASSGAIGRLSRKGHRDLVPLDQVALPTGMRWLVPEGTKSGEAWLSIDGPHGAGPTWLVCDAFFNVTARPRGLEGPLLRLLRVAPGLSVGATFTWLCLNDPGRYRDWVEGALAREAPQRILFSHGDPLDSDAAVQLTSVLRTRLGKVAP